MDGVYTIVRKWTEGKAMENAKVKTLPIWIGLPEFPAHMCCQEVFSTIGSVLGSPVKIDAHTAKGANPNSAKLLVIMEATGIFSTEVPIYIQGDDGVESEKTCRVNYLKMPPICKRCNSFGHQAERCIIEEEAPDEAEGDQEGPTSKNSTIDGENNEKSDDANRSEIPAKNDSAGEDSRRGKDVARKSNREEPTNADVAKRTNQRTPNLHELDTRVLIKELQSRILAELIESGHVDAQAGEEDPDTEMGEENENLFQSICGKVNNGRIGSGSGGPNELKETQLVEYDVETEVSRNRIYQSNKGREEDDVPGEVRAMSCQRRKKKKFHATKDSLQMEDSPHCTAEQRLVEERRGIKNSRGTQQETVQVTSGKKRTRGTEDMGREDVDDSDAEVGEMDNTSTDLIVILVEGDLAKYGRKKQGEGDEHNGVNYLLSKGLLNKFHLSGLTSLNQFSQ
ncbi:hypothetical protein ZOSMA_3G01850 [Zostera marina]|uniref:Uncharacterized protein n=1 Tax=Zostera marina TaxID=29655 RepID=A0A0K9P3T8_ZOSMR|nr:hypothetical protein ZOSMA_3G01850 [Zostera marina]